MAFRDISNTLSIIDFKKVCLVALVIFAAISAVLLVQKRLLNPTNAAVDTLTITAITPADGPATGGTTVEITYELPVASNITSVTFGGVVATNLTQKSTTSISITTPAHTDTKVGGAVDVVITSANSQTATLTNGFNYTPTTVDPSQIAACGGNSECFAFTIDTRLTETGETTGTATSFMVPTARRFVYNWIINWGDGSAEQTVSGTGSVNSAISGITHDYSTTNGAGIYQITIRPNATATAGWMAAFGFIYDANTFSGNTNSYMFYSIDTSLTNLMYSQSATSNRFSGVFAGTRNAIGIPHNLYSQISTSGVTNFNHMFYCTFLYFAYNASTATIPEGLFDTIATTNGTDFIYMFYYTFYNFAYNSPTATIPEGLFDSIATTNGTDFSGMFSFTFADFAYNSPTATTSQLDYLTQ